MFKRDILKSAFCIVSLLAVVRPAYSWEMLDHWRPPKVFSLAPSADTLFFQFEKPSTDIQDSPKMTKSSYAALGLYPFDDRLVAGINFSGYQSILSGQMSNEDYTELQIRESKVELAGLYALSETHSIYVAPGVRYLKSEYLGHHFEEFFQVLTAYTVWALADNAGFGVGLSAGRNSRKSYFVPLIGGAWQYTPNFRIDGWLPANLAAILKVAENHAIIAKIEATGTGGLVNNKDENYEYEAQMIGANLLAGWSFRYPLGLGSGIAKFEPAFGVFRGKFTYANQEGGTSRSEVTPFRPIFHIRTAISF